jgi:hypothetical protein
MFFFFKNEEPKSSNTSWQPTCYEFHHLEDYWFDICGIRNPLHLYSFEEEQNLFHSEISKCFYRPLDYMIDKLEYACEREFNSNPKYLDCNWIYYTCEKKDGYIIEDIVNNIVENLCEGMELFLNFPHDIYEKIESKIKKQLYKIGLEYFKVQFKNQSMQNYLCDNDIRYHKMKKAKEIQEKLKDNPMMLMGINKFADYCGYF